MWRGVAPYAFRIFRTVFYLLVAIDTYALSESISKTPYSTFTITKVPWLFEDTLDWVPSTLLLERAYFACAVVSFIAALCPNVLYTVSSCAVAFFYCFTYAVNSLDRFQHHYMVCLLLCLLPWARTRQWVQKLMFRQMSLVYFWTAVVKLSDGGGFMRGDFLRTSASRLYVFEGIHLIAKSILISDETLWRFLALTVVSVEIMLAVLLWTRKAPLLTMVCGISMHLGFEFVGRLSIRLFSYYLFAFYMLCLPHIK